MAEIDEGTFLEDDFGDERPVGVTSQTVEATIRTIMAGSSVWRPGGVVELGPGMAWRFHLASDDPKAVLHVHLTEVLRHYILQRLRAAREVGYEVHIALPLDALYRSEVQVALAQFDAHVHLVDGGVVRGGVHHLDALSGERVAVNPTARTAIGLANWERRGRGTSQEKGRFFEALLAFLFELVPDFRVVERNYRGDSDEVDIWLQIDNWSQRCWQESGVPFILIEGKNRQERSGAPFVIHIKGQLREKRRRTRIGILCSTSPFSSDAATEVIKLAESEYSVALLGPDELKAWIESPEPTDFLEALIRKAMIR